MAHGGLANAGLITLDAHHDLRDGRSNGSPVRRLIEMGLNFGISAAQKRKMSRMIRIDAAGG